jgi:hypothetical protein
MEMNKDIKIETFSTGSFDDEPDDLAFWLSRSPEDRIEAVEIISRQFYSYGKAEQEFRRFLEIAEREKG